MTNKDPYKEILYRKRFLLYKRLQYIKPTMRIKEELLNNYSSELVFLNSELKNLREEVFGSHNNEYLNSKYKNEILLIEERIQFINNDTKSLKLDIEKLEKQFNEESKELSEIMLVLEKLSVKE